MKHLATIFAAVAFLMSMAGSADAQVALEKGIEYSNSDNQHLQLDMARPSAASWPLPAMICIPGGGFRAGTRDGVLCLNQQISVRGQVAVWVS